MILGRVVGTVWSTRKDPRLERRKLLLVQPYFAYNPTHDTRLLVAVDAGVDAGVGDDVVVCLGTPARQSLGSKNLPIDAAIMAVVDRVQLSAEPLSPGAARPLSFLGEHRPRALEWLP